MNDRTFVTHSSALATATWYASVCRTRSLELRIFFWYWSTASTDCRALRSDVMTKVGALIRARIGSSRSAAVTLLMPAVVRGSVAFIMVFQYSTCSAGAAEPSRSRCVSLTHFGVNRPAVVRLKTGCVVGPDATTSDRVRLGKSAANCIAI